MDKNKILNQITEYIGVLNKSLTETTYSADRIKYQKHLASASLIVKSLLDDDMNSLKTVIEDEKRSYGWDYLSGEYGENVEQSFNDLIGILEKL